MNGKGLSKKKSQALYPVASRPVLSSLDKIYRVHCARKRMRTGGSSPTLYEIGQAAKIESDGYDKKDLATKVKQCLNKADILVEYVGLGLFPVFTRSSGEIKKKIFLSDDSRSSGQRNEFEKFINKGTYHDRVASEIVEILNSFPDIDQIEMRI